LNADDPLVMKMRTIVPDRVFTFGLSATADVFGSSVTRDEKGFAFLLNDSVPARLPVPGAHNVVNALAAVAVCRRLGLDLDYIAGRLASFTLPPMRLQERSFRGALILNDSYNANPESMARVIDELAARPAARRFFVFADMLELGDQSAALHRELGEKAAAASFDFYWAVGSEADRAVKSAVAAGVPNDRAKFFDSIKNLGLALAGELKKGDVAVVKGSRAMGLERVLDYLK
jgi:UDP-N-acetylmuramoyl-tripeptide--D-alanyl-D-alanine ligase